MSTETRRRGREPLPPPGPRERKRLEKLYVTEGLTVAEVADRLGTTPRRAQAMLVRAGIPLRRRGPRPLGPPPESERRRLERMYTTEGLTAAEVGRRLGVSRDRAEAMLVRAHIPLRRYDGPQLPDIETITHLYIEEKLSTHELARMFQTHQRTVWRALADAGVPRRPRGSGNKAKWPEKITRKALEDLYVAQRLPIPEVARELRVGPASVSRALRAYGIPADGAGRRRRCPPRDELVDLYVHQGLSTADLAVRFGVHRRTPWHWLDDAGIPRRPGRGVRQVTRRRRSPVMGSGRRPGGGVASAELLTPAQAAVILRVHPKTVTRWAREGRIAAQRTAGGHRRFAAADIARFAGERDG